MSLSYRYESNINCSADKLDLTKVTKNIIPLFESHINQNFDELLVIKDIIQKKFNNLVIIGMGGASNSPAILMNLQQNNNFKIYIVNTPAPNLNNNVKNSIELNKTAFLVISKSGTTIETVAITKYWLNQALQQNLSITKHFYFILGANNNSTALITLAQSYGCNIISHINFSGRFAVFSNIITLPAMLMGLNIHSFLDGGHAALQEFQSYMQQSIVVKAAADIISLLNQNINNHVIISYLLELNNFLNWQCQITAESLAKNGFGITPIKNIGPNSQHSYFQLYLHGPKDKFFTFYTVKNHHNQETISNDLSKLIQNQSITAYNFFKEKNLPVRKIELSKLNEYSLGFLTMNTILETAIIAAHFNINLFDQPAVEEIKARIIL